jgi:hypothetical protein
VDLRMLEADADHLTQDRFWRKQIRDLFDYYDRLTRI